MSPRTIGRPPKETEAATGNIQIRVTPRRKSAYKAAAAPQKLTEWMTRVLDAAAGYEPK